MFTGALEVLFFQLSDTYWLGLSDGVKSVLDGEKSLLRWDFLSGDLVSGKMSLLLSSMTLLGTLTGDSFILFLES